MCACVFIFGIDRANQLTDEKTSVVCISYRKKKNAARFLIGTRWVIREGYPASSQVPYTFLAQADQQRSCTIYLFRMLCILDSFVSARVCACVSITPPAHPLVLMRKASAVERLSALFDACSSRTCLFPEDYKQPEHPSPQSIITIQIHAKG